MRKPTPKTHRKILRRPIKLEPGISITSFDVSDRGSRIEKLPPFGEYDPNRVHVARRRRAHKENKMFPRGWKFEFGGATDYQISESAVKALTDGAMTTITKTSKGHWTVFGEDIS